jgi:phosphoribosylformylglycinamidine cyclo-ligase
MFFLEYIALGKNVPERVAEIVSGVAEGCVQAGCALVGGETAEMPGFYAPDEYDLAGFSVGVVDEQRILSPENAKAGDVLIGAASSGVHSNGFSLVRRVFDVENRDLNVYVPEFSRTLGEELLTPTRIYVRAALAAVETGGVRSIAHITGGGFYENVPRMLKPGLTAVIRKAAIPPLPVFDLIRQAGKIPERDMYNTFNMGVGLILAVAGDDAGRAMDLLKQNGKQPFDIGRIETGDEGVTLC